MPEFLTVVALNATFVSTARSPIAAFSLMVSVAPPTTTTTTYTPASSSTSTTLPNCSRVHHIGLFYCVTKGSHGTNDIANLHSEIVYSLRLLHAVFGVLGSTASQTP